MLDTTMQNTVLVLMLGNIHSSAGADRALRATDAPTVLRRMWRTSQSLRSDETSHLRGENKPSLIAKRPNQWRCSLDIAYLRRRPAAITLLPALLLRLPALLLRLPALLLRLTTRPPEPPISRETSSSQMHIACRRMTSARCLRASALALSGTSNRRVSRCMELLLAARRQPGRGSGDGCIHPVAPPAPSARVLPWPLDLANA
jgi:hypothetical protein